MIKLALPLLVWLVAAPASASTPQAQAAWDKGDYRQAFAEAFEPALAGDPQAQFMLGEAYRLGRSVEPNALAAQEWYMRAAKQGHVAAATELGRIYLQLRNMRDAVPWLTMAASHDDARAMATLCCCPPESCSGLQSALSDRPTCSSNSSASARTALMG